jgi:predicted nucleotidyltransferase
MFYTAERLANTAPLSERMGKPGFPFPFASGRLRRAALRAAAAPEKHSMPRDPFPDLERLATIFGQYPEIHAVYLFGSAVTGNLHAESDLDLAIVPRPGTAAVPKLDLLADLARAGFCRVDLVVLDTPDIVLKHEAVRHNRLVYRADDFDHGAHFSQTVRQFLDFRPYLDVQRQAYKRRMSHDPT